MAKKDTQDPAAIVLTAPHTHAGRDYPPGTRLVLADVGMDTESAQWLVTLGKARWAPAAPAPAPEASA